MTFIPINRYGTEVLVPDMNDLGGSCPAPMTRSALLALRTAGSLDINCAYVITDHVQGRLVTGTLIRLDATSPTVLSEAVSVQTTYDNEAWSGIYDIDRGLVLELRDNRMNVVRGFTGIEVANFDWGNTSYTNVTIDHGILTSTIGGAVTVNNVTVEKAAALNVSGFTGTLNNATITQESVVTLSGANGTWRDFTVSENSVLNAATYTGGNSQEFFTVAGASSIDISARSAPVLLRSSKLNKATVVATGVTGVTKLLEIVGSQINSSLVTQVNTVTANLRIQNSVVSGNSTISAIFGRIFFDASTLDRQSTLTNDTINAVVDISSSVISGGSTLTNSGTGQITLVNSAVENGSTIIEGAGCTIGYILANATVSEFSTIQNNGLALTGRLDLNAGFRLVGRSTINKFAAHTATAEFRYGMMNDFSVCNCRSGDRQTLFNRIELANTATIELQGTGAVLDNFGGFDIRRGNLVVSCSGAANTINDVFVYGQVATFTLSGTTGGQNALTSRIRLFDSSMTMNNCSARVDVLYLTAQNSSVVNFSNITAVGKTFRDISVSDLSTFDALGPYSSAGPDGCSQINVNTNGTFRHSLAAISADNVFVSSGTLIHNGGALNDANKTMSSTLTTGNFNHSGIIHATRVNKTLTVANSNQADYITAAPLI